MNQENKYINAITEFVRNLPTLDNRIDEVLEPVKDYSDTLGDLIFPVKIVLTTLTVSNKRKFRRFIKGFALNVDEGRITEEYVGKLEKYLKKEVNMEYVAEIIDSSIKAKSSRCSAIMGYYAGVLLNEFREVQYKDMVVLNALTVINNKDLEYFNLLFERFNSLRINSFRVYDMQEDINSLGVPVFEIENTIEKLKSVQVLGYDIGGISNVGNAWGAFVFNENTFYFYEVIKKSGVMEIVDFE